MISLVSLKLLLNGGNSEFMTSPSFEQTNCTCASWQPAGKKQKKYWNIRPELWCAIWKFAVKVTFSSRNSHFSLRHLRVDSFRNLICCNYREWLQHSVCDLAWEEICIEHRLYTNPRQDFNSHVKLAIRQSALWNKQLSFCFSNLDRVIPYIVLTMCTDVLLSQQPWFSSREADIILLWLLLLLFFG